MRSESQADRISQGSGSTELPAAIEGLARLRGMVLTGGDLEVISALVRQQGAGMDLIYGAAIGRWDMPDLFDASVAWHIRPLGQNGASG